MSTTIKFAVQSTGTLSASVTLADPSDTYGVRNRADNSIIVASGVPLVATATAGEFEYTFADPLPGLVYQYFLRVEYLGEVYYFEKDTSQPSSQTLIVSRYSTGVCLDRSFGRDNVYRWAEVSAGDVSSSEAVIQESLDMADAYVDNMLNGGPYVVPFTEPAPQIIQRIACKLAGSFLYSAKGEIDYNPADAFSVNNRSQASTPANRMHWHLKHATDMLSEIRNGNLNLIEVTRTVDYPVIS